MPATPCYPQSPPPSVRAADELERIGLESARCLNRAGDLLIHVGKRPESVAEEDVSLLREARRDLEHGRILLEGMCRRHRLEVSP